MEQYDPVGGGFLVQSIIDFFTGASSSGDFPVIYATLGFFKVIFLLFMVLFIIGIVYVGHELWKLRPDYKLVYDRNTIPQKKVSKERWKGIMQRFSGGTEADWRLAIIEADSLVEEVFKKIGFEGETLGERISNITQQEVKSIVELRNAHQLRNRLVHTPGYRVEKDDAERAIRNYEKVLNELEVI